MKSKMEERGAKEGLGVISGRFVLPGQWRHTQKPREDSIKYHMQWPYCHGYRMVKNINQACAYNKEKWNGGRRRATADTGREGNGTASVCLIWCILMSEVAKVHNCPLLALNICMLTLKMPLLTTDSFAFVINTFQNAPASISASPAHIYTKTSQTCEMNSIPNSFHRGVWGGANSLFSSERFILVPSQFFKLNFMCHNFCWRSLGKEIKQSLHIYNPSHAHESINNPTCKCLPHENEMFSSITFLFCVRVHLHMILNKSLKKKKKHAGIRLQMHAKILPIIFNHIPLWCFSQSHFPARCRRGKLKIVLFDEAVVCLLTVCRDCLKNNQSETPPAEQNVK